MESHHKTAVFNITVVFVILGLECMQMTENELLDNLDKLHTISLGIERVKKNLS